MARSSDATMFWKYGVPFFSFMVIGTYGLSLFVQGRYDMKDSRQAAYDERMPADKIRRRQFNVDWSIEKEAEMLKEHIQNDYEMKPGPKFE